MIQQREHLRSIMSLETVLYRYLEDFSLLHFLHTISLRGGFLL